MTPREVLIAAKALIDTPEKWTQGWYARNAEGSRASYKTATCFCSVGAIERASRGEPMSEYERAYDILYAALPGQPLNVAEWNDAPERTHAEVMDAFARAIELAADAETVANLNRDLAAVVP